MGLDCLWIPKSPNENLPVFDPPLTLCVGIATAPTTAFRGKVYALFFEHMLQVDLYEDMDAAKVRYVADQLEKAVNELSPVYDEHDDICHVTRQELSDLARMFRQFAIIGASLIAWY